MLVLARNRLLLEVLLDNHIRMTICGGLRCPLGSPQNAWKSQVRNLALAGNGISSLTGYTHMTPKFYGVRRQMTWKAYSDSSHLGNSHLLTAT
jgi:hypothetical protein